MSTVANLQEYQNQPPMEVIDMGLLSPELTGKAVKLPVSIDQALVPEIDKDYLVEKEVLSDVWTCFHSRKPLWLYGGAGVGKTDLVRKIAGVCQRSVYDFTSSEDTESVDYSGVMGAEEGSSTTVYSSLAQALRHDGGLGAVCIISEMDMARSSVNSSLNTLLDNTRSLTIPHSGEVLKAGPNFKLVVTANSAGNGDPTGRYPVQRQSKAFMDRFLKIRLESPTEEFEVKILMQRFPSLDKSVAEVFVKFAQAIRSSAKGKEIELDGQTKKVSLRKDLTTRSLIDWVCEHQGAGGKKPLAKTLDWQMAYTEEGFELDAKVIHSIGVTIFGNQLWGAS